MVDSLKSPDMRPIASTHAIHPVRSATAPQFAAAERFDVPLKDAVFTVLDCEMTGLSLYGDDLTEVTAIQYRNGQEIGRYSSLAKPSKVIPARIEQLTGITNAMVKNAPPPRQVLEELAQFVGPTPLITGDYIGVDTVFINEWLQRYNLTQYADRFDLDKTICTRTLGNKIAPTLTDAQTDRLLATATRPAHRAENDVRNCADFLYALIDVLKASGGKLDTARDLKTYQGPSMAYVPR